MSRNQQKFDVHQEVTNRIVAALETAGEFQLPWIRNKGGSMKRPVNIASAKPYNGVNIVSLWVAAQACDYPSHLWGTYRQWQERGSQVRRGEKSSLIVFYKQLEYQQTNEQTGEAELAERMMARASFVFNAAQVDGFKLDDTSQPLPGEPTFDPIERAEAFAKATGAKIEEGGDMACYIPAVDMIRIGPELALHFRAAARRLGMLRREAIQEAMFLQGQVRRFLVRIVLLHARAEVAYEVDAELTDQDVQRLGILLADATRGERARCETVAAVALHDEHAA